MSSQRLWIFSESPAYRQAGARPQNGFGLFPVYAALRLASLAQCEHSEALVLRGLGREVYPEFIEGNPSPAATLRQVRIPRSIVIFCINMNKKTGNELGGVLKSSKFERLPTKELDQVWAIVLEEYPELTILQMEKLMPAKEDFLQYTGGEFIASTDSEKPLVRIVLGDIKHLESLRAVRNDSVKIVLEKLGLALEKVDAKILNLLIFLHEVGHGRDYIVNYLNNPIYPDKDASNDDWYEHYENQLNALPVPGLDPTDLRIRLKELGGLQAFRVSYPELDLIFQKHNIQNEEDLLRVQEVAYRNLPHESYADDFACKVLRGHWETIGLDPSLLKELPSFKPEEN